MKIQLLHLWTTRQNEKDWRSRFLAPILLQQKSLFNRKCWFECDTTDVSVGAFSPKSITMHDGTWLKTGSGRTKRTYYLMELESTAAGKGFIQVKHYSGASFSAVKILLPTPCSPPGVSFLTWRVSPHGRHKTISISLGFNKYRAGQRRFTVVLMENNAVINKW